jgi:hypothetical protein
MIEYISEIYSGVVGGTIGLTAGVFLKRILSVIAKVIVVVSSLVVLYKFCKDHPKIFRMTCLIIVLTTLIFTLSSCSNNQGPSYRISSKGDVINELRPLKGIFCEKELIDFRMRFNKFMTCADANSFAFISNIDSENCQTLKSKVIETRKIYESCRLEHKSDNIISNPFNLIRDDI